MWLGVCVGVGGCVCVWVCGVGVSEGHTTIAFYITWWKIFQPKQRYTFAWSLELSSHHDPSNYLWLILTPGLRKLSLLLILTSGLRKLSVINSHFWSEKTIGLSVINSHFWSEKTISVINSHFWCERHNRNAQVQHLSCRCLVVVLLWCETTINLAPSEERLICEFRPDSDNCYRAIVFRSQVATFVTGQSSKVTES